jgi:hypothetical protein
VAPCFPVALAASQAEMTTLSSLSWGLYDAVLPPLLLPVPGCFAAAVEFLLKVWVRQWVVAVRKLPGAVCPTDGVALGQAVDVVINLSRSPRSTTLHCGKRRIFGPKGSVPLQVSTVLMVYSPAAFASANFEASPSLPETTLPAPCA